MSIYLQLHPVSPQRRFIRQAVDVLRAGGVIVYPTDSCYALGCHIGDKAALERIRKYVKPIGIITLRWYAGFWLM